MPRTEQELNIVCINGYTIVVISGNELSLGMSLIKMLKRIGPNTEPWGTPYKLGVPQGSVLRLCCSSCAPRSFFLYWRKSLSVMPTSPL